MTRSSRAFRNVLGALALISVLIVTVAPAAAQEILPHEIARRTEPLAIDSGAINARPGAGAAWETTVRFDGAPWLRLFFAEAALAPGAYVRVTSLFDGHSQVLPGWALEAWSNSTAYFNGDALKVELVAPRGGISRLVLSEASVGEVPIGVDSICGSVDDRTQSNDPRQGRAMPIGCTAWLINDCAKCFLTAGHCSTSSLQVIQFNVPNSLSNGAVQNPPPSDQYPVDVSSKQSVNGGTGNDWGYFGTFRNTTTGLTPHEAMGGGAYSIAAAAPAVGGQAIRITGYGTSSIGTLNQVQKTHTGPYVSVAGNLIRYAVDTTGGNSGSPVVDVTTGLAIGIHTHAGCSSGGGSNQGTNIGRAELRTALNNPLGVCSFGLIGDTNNDRVVNFLDLNTVISQYGQTGPVGSIPGDVNRDGVVNFADINVVINGWLSTC